jgi:hypothetical protein
LSLFATGEGLAAPAAVQEQQDIINFLRSF